MDGRRLDSFRRFLTESSVVESAQRLLGCEIVSGSCCVRIVEAEAYGGGDDLGSHACRGMTPRTVPMFGPAGHAFVYFTYGNHWMFCVTCRPVGEAGAVLVRGTLPLEGVEVMRLRRPKAFTESDLLSGPGKIGAALAVDGSHSGVDLLGGGTLSLVPGEVVRSVLVGPRIGLSAGKGDEKLWRFIDVDFLQWASKPWPR